jgi:hypothetical protein
MMLPPEDSGRSARLGLNAGASGCGSERGGPMEAERIVLEPVGDGKHWRVRPEGGDVEAHIIRGRGFSTEPAGEEGGEPVYRITADGDDVEGHATRWSDRRLKREITPVESALSRLRRLQAAG